VNLRLSPDEYKLILRLRQLKKQKAGLVLLLLETMVLFVPGKPEFLNGNKENGKGEESINHLALAAAAEPVPQP
jgi:hypothetical protein